MNPSGDSWPALYDDMNSQYEDSWHHFEPSAENGSDERSLPITDADTVGPQLAPTKPSNVTRMYFVNVNGISYDSDGGDFNTITSTVAHYDIDVLGISETHLDTSRRPVCEALRKAARSQLRSSHVNLVTATSSLQYPSYVKPGGTLLLSQGSITGRHHHHHAVFRGCNKEDW